MAAPGGPQTSPRLSRASGRFGWSHLCHTGGLCRRAGSLFEDSHASPQVHRASPGTGQNQESSCGMWRLMTHLENERHVQGDLDQLRRWSAVRDRPERLRNAARHLSGQEKRSGCCRLRCRAVPSATNQRAREAHCRVRVPVRRLEGDRSGHRETEKAQPATRHVDAYRVTIVANPPCCAQHDSHFTSTDRIRNCPPASEVPLTGLLQVRASGILVSKESPRLRCGQSRS